MRTIYTRLLRAGDQFYYGGHGLLTVMEDPTVLPRGDVKVRVAGRHKPLVFHHDDRVRLHSRTLPRIA